MSALTGSMHTILEFATSDTSQIGMRGAKQGSQVIRYGLPHTDLTTAEGQATVLNGVETRAGEGAQWRRDALAA